MYRSNMHYGGWRDEPPSRVNSEVIPLPLPPPLRPRTVGVTCQPCTSWYSYGVVLCLLSLASLALGVTDVILTYKTYMEDRKCKDTTTPDYCLPSNLVFTWIAVGIWASVPVFMFGVYCIYRGNNTSQQLNWFQLLAFFSALIFTPAMIVISAIEVYRGRNVYYWKAMNLEKDDLIKAIIPIVIAGLGLVEHIMSLSALMCVCCCTAHTAQTRAQSTAHVYGTSLVDMGKTTVINSIQPTNRMQPLSANQLPCNMCRPTSNQACRVSSGPNYPTSVFPPSPTRTTMYSHWAGSNQCPPVTPNPAYNYFRT